MGHLITASVILLLLACLTALPIDLTVHRLWDQSDIDKNGIFSREELEHVLIVYDANGDGMVTRHEYVNHMPHDLHQFAHALFDVYDANKNHELDDSDLDDMYKRVDTDGNGEVDNGEFVAFWTKILEDTHHLHGHVGHEHGHEPDQF